LRCDGTAGTASTWLCLETPALCAGLRTCSGKKRRIRRVLGNLQRRSIVLVEDETDLLLFRPLRAM
jgi:hypothetical protein